MWLQWLAVIGGALALVSAIGLVFVRSETSERQTKRLSAAQDESQRAKRVSDRLRLQLTPRHLDETQRALLASRLKGVATGPIIIMAMKMDPEATAYAEQIAAVLISSGYAVGPYSGPLVLNMTPGVWIVVNPGAPRETAEAVSGALNDCGIRCVVSTNAAVTGKVPLLGIGPKPSLAAEDASVPSDDAAR